MRAAIALAAVSLIASQASAQNLAEPAGPTFEPPDLTIPKDGGGKKGDVARLFTLRACGFAKVESCEELGGTVQVVWSSAPGNGSKLPDKGKLKPGNGGTKADATPTSKTMPGDGITKLPGGKTDPSDGGPKREPFTGFDPKCTCVITTFVDPRISNALKGDAGLVPMSDDDGDEVVRVVTATIGQFHRHAVIFTDAGSTVRHATSFNEFGDDDLETNTKLKPGVLANGLPGFTTQTIEYARAFGRMETTGLVLKPLVEELILDFRSMFEAAADHAVGIEGYYKISDYTGLDSMDKAYSTAMSDIEEDDLRGTMCSGFVHWAFTEAGFVVSLTEYDEGIRMLAAEAVFDEVKALIADSLGWFESIGASLLGSKKKIANQVVNCFAGLGCDDNSNTWKSGVGAGLTVSPDNLLPESFTLSGSGEAPWFDNTIEAGDTVENDHGADVTPFLRVEPMNYVGAYIEVTVLEEW